MRWIREWFEDLQERTQPGLEKRSPIYEDAVCSVCGFRFSPPVELPECPRCGGENEEHENESTGR